MATLIIGFGNKARHGKDTAAAAISEYFEAKTYKYATALYAEVNEALAANIWKYRQIGSTTVDALMKPYIELPDWVQPDPSPEFSELAPYGKHPKLLQWWGTEYRRTQDPDYWVKRTYDKIEADKADIALITDVRFPNEGDAVRARGGYTVNVQRLTVEGKPFVDASRPADHPSETAMDSYNWDFYIKSKSAEYTRSAAINLVEFLKGRV